MIQAIIHTDPETGEVFTYERDGTRIKGDHGTEINVWDHAADKPGIDFHPDAVRAAVEEWISDEKEADQPADGAGCDLCEETETWPSVPPAGQLVGRDRVTDGAGCTERISSIERDFLSGESPYS